MVNDIFAVLGSVIIWLELTSLMTLLFFSYQTASQFFVGGKKDISSD